MKMLRNLNLAFLLVIFCLAEAASWLQPLPLSHTNSPEKCSNTFHAFAYWGPLAIPQDKIVMTTPWRQETMLPPHSIEGFNKDYREVNVAGVRSHNGAKEVWITGEIVRFFESMPIIMVYETITKTWHFISPNIGDTNFFVSDLFIDSNGRIWGITDWKQEQRFLNDNLPILSLFNESIQEFEPATGILELPLTRYANDSAQNSAANDVIKVIVDDDNNIWFYIRNDGLYKYDTTIQKTEKLVNIPDREIRDFAISLDGTIFLSLRTDPTTSSTRASFTVAQGTLIQFVPETGELVQIQISDTRWPTYSGMLVDRLNRLWLGSIGFREPNGDWKLLHPSPDTYFDHFENFLWSPPSLVLESSNGVLWFRKDLDTGGLIEGTAWYDPDTESGCWFTSIPGNIVEDSEQNLWMLVDGNLYRLDLNPK